MFINVKYFYLHFLIILTGFSSSNNFLLNFNIKKAKSILELKKMYS